MKNYISIVFLCAILFAACKTDVNAPLEADGAAPKKITDLKVENTPGGAKLTYNVPSDPNLLYVLAEVGVGNGITRVFKSSHYNNTLQIDGVPNTAPRMIKVYSVNKSELRSEPIDVEIKPLTPPFLEVFKTIDVDKDFGGVKVIFQNKTGADLAIAMQRVKPDGTFADIGTYFTKLKEGNYTFRGLEAKTIKVATFIKDRWGNSSDTLYKEVTPLFEKMLDKGLFKDITLPGDASIYTTEWNIAKRFIWDGNWSSNFNEPYGNWLNVSTNGPNDGTPMHITFDMGVTAKLSRFRINHYYRYIDRGMRKYEIWGRTATPVDGSWNGWVKLISYEQKKPSGLPGESYTAADAEAWIAGDNGNFDNSFPAVRYIRIKCLENWVGHGNLNFAEISLYGSDQ
uniref:DUF5000 domain-containing lipoprotein n=1 Tax=Pedobacter schmidteae TaxID=2201271 RepID=UPI000EB0FEE4|nr:DUF5000 domain-containing lipoprotein [Pedobacter schmidteae]